MLIAKEGARELLAATVVLGGLAVAASWVWWPLALPFALLWAWVVYFFRDPQRRGRFQEGDLCSPADGRVTEVTEIPFHPLTESPAIRIGIFLSLFNVHVNRSPCGGRVSGLSYRKGEFLDARHPESGRLNESNTILIEPKAPMPGPIEVRQVAGLVARRIVCNVRADDGLRIGDRLGMIKFGSRTELIFPKLEGTTVLVDIGDRVRGGLTILARQPVARPVETATMRGFVGKSAP